MTLGPIFETWSKALSLQLLLRLLLLLQLLLLSHHFQKQRELLLPCLMGHGGGSGGAVGCLADTAVVGRKKSWPAETRRTMEGQPVSIQENGQDPGDEWCYRLRMLMLWMRWE